MLSLFGLLSEKFPSAETQADALKALCHMLGAEAGSIILLNEEDERSALRLTIRMTRDETGGQARSSKTTVKIGGGLLEACMRGGEALLISDLQIEPAFDPLSETPADVKAVSALYAPIQTNDKTFGAVQVFHHTAGFFDPHSRDFVSTWARLFASSLERSHLIQRLQAENAILNTNREELLNSRNTLRALFDSMPAALYIVNRDYRLIAVNMSCAQRTGKPPKKLVRTKCYRALYRRSQPCPGCRIGETFSNGESTLRSERRAVGVEATEWEISTFPIIDEGGEISQAILLEQEVTEKRRLEGIVAQSEKLAAIGQLAAGVAHEINNPLTAILANAQILQRELPADDDLQELIQLIARAGARASQVVRNLLDFARKEQYHLDATDVNETIRRSLALVQHELVNRELRVSFQPDDSLPTILASQDHLLSVWLNLLMNAIDAVSASQGEIRITTRKVKDHIQVVISDNGAGIPAESLANIFEPFYTTKAPGRGTGLGLSVCHRIIKQHGGHIEVESQVGRGTQFTVALPVSTGDLATVASGIG